MWVFRCPLSETALPVFLVWSALNQTGVIETSFVFASPVCFRVCKGLFALFLVRLACSLFSLFVSSLYLFVFGRLCLPMGNLYICRCLCQTLKVFSFCCLYWLLLFFFFCCAVCLFYSACLVYSFCFAFSVVSVLRCLVCLAFWSRVEPHRVCQMSFACCLFILSVFFVGGFRWLFLFLFCLFVVRFVCWSFPLLAFYFILSVCCLSAVYSFIRGTWWCRLFVFMFVCWFCLLLVFRFILYIAIWSYLLSFVFACWAVFIAGFCFILPVVSCFRLLVILLRLLGIACCLLFLCPSDCLLFYLFSFLACLCALSFVCCLWCLPVVTFYRLFCFFLPVGIGSLVVCSVIRLFLLYCSLWVFLFVCLLFCTVASCPAWCCVVSLLFRFTTPSVGFLYCLSAFVLSVGVLCSSDCFLYRLFAFVPPVCLCTTCLVHVLVFGYFRVWHDRWCILVLVLSVGLLFGHLALLSGCVWFCLVICVIVWCLGVCSSFALACRNLVFVCCLIACLCFLSVFSCFRLFFLLSLVFYLLSVGFVLALFIVCFFCLSPCSFLVFVFSFACCLSVPNVFTATSVGLFAC